MRTVTFYDENGKEIPFVERIKELGPDLYQPYMENILKGWPQSDWVHADEYIAPIAAQIIIDACELDPEMFAKIMTVIEEAYHKFQPIINPHQLSLVK